MYKVHQNSAYVTLLSCYNSVQFMYPTCTADSSEKNMNILNSFTIPNVSLLF